MCGQISPEGTRQARAVLSDLSDRTRMREDRKLTSVLQDRISSVLQARISSVLEDLARAAVLEIRGVLEEVLQLEIRGVLEEVLQVEIRQSRRENELLKKKISLLEKNTRAGGFCSLKRPQSSRNDCSSRDQLGAQSDHSNIVKKEPSNLEEPDMLIIKEETIQMSCGSSSGAEDFAEFNICPLEMCLTNTAVFPSVGREEDSGKQDEEDKIPERSVAAAHLAQFENDMFYEGVEREALVGLVIRTGCGESESAGCSSDLPPDHTEFLPALQLTSPDVKPDFLISGPEPAEEPLDGQEVLQSMDPPDRTRCSPISERFLGVTFSATSGDCKRWTSGQQGRPNQPGGGPQELHGDVLLNCSVCGKSFSQTKQLKLHERIHVEEKVFRCVRCGRQFPQLCRLRRHERVHTGERPFPCAKCGKKFAHANNLKVHQSVHTGERRFSCAQCGKSFSFLSNLIRHKAVHSGK